jgi:TonB family protein
MSNSTEMSPTLETPSRRRFLRALLPAAAASLVGRQLLAQPSSLSPAETAAMKDYVRRAGDHIAKFRRDPFTNNRTIMKGRVVVRVTVARDGKLLDVAVVQSSGNATIDASELDTVRRAAPLPPLPPEVTKPSMKMDMPVNYEVPAKP